MKTEMQKLETRILNAQKRLGVMMATMMVINDMQDTQISLEFDQKQLGRWEVISIIKKKENNAGEPQ